MQAGRDQERHHLRLPIELDADEVCRRCGSDEIYPVARRSKTYASALLYWMFGLVLYQFINWGAEAAGGMMSHQFNIAALLLITAIPFIAVVLSNMLPKKRCRNCGLEWRGIPRTN